jgi:RIO-like serine/threonine protein kinase
MLRTITMLLHQVFEDYHIYYRAHIHHGQLNKYLG